MKENLMIWCGDESSFSKYQAFIEYCSTSSYIEQAHKTYYEDLEDDQKVVGAEMVTFRGDIAIVSITGTLVAKYNIYNSWFGLVSYEEIKGAISYAVESGAKKIVLDIDSGGGDVNGLDECANYIKEVSTKVVPIYAHTSTVAASGAYWLACSCKTITASKMAHVGSIGVIAVHVSYADAVEESGISVTIFRAGEFKALGHPYEKLSDAAKNKIQESLDTTYNYFLEHVSINRKLSINNKNKWAEGLVFISNKALSLNLIDSINYLSHFVEKLYVTNNNPLLGMNVSENHQEEDDLMSKKLVKSPEELAALSLGAEVNVTDEQVDANQTDEQVTDEQVTDEQVTDEEVTETQETEETVTDTKVSTVNGIDPLVHAQALTEKAMAENRVNELLAKAEQTENDLKALSNVAITAINKLQIALHETPTDLTGMSPSVILDMYSKKEALFNDTFKIGASSSQNIETKTGDDTATDGIYPV